MTLNTKIRVLWIFGDSGLQATFQERVSQNLRIDHDEPRVKFSALNVDFNGPSLDLLGSRKPAMRASKSGTP